MFFEPVVVANRLMWRAMLSSGRFTTHWPVLRIFCGVLLSDENPRIHRWPSQKTDEMAQILSGPFSFSEVTSTTGVPKYRMLGEMMECVIVMIDEMLVIVKEEKRRNSNVVVI